MRTPGRKRHKPRINAPGKYYGMGPQFEDAVSGWYFPKRAKLLKGPRGPISSAYKDGSRDRPDSY